VAVVVVLIHGGNERAVTGGAAVRLRVGLVRRRAATHRHNVRHNGPGQLPPSPNAELNQTVLTWEFPVLNVYLLVYAFSLSL